MISDNERRGASAKLELRLALDEEWVQTAYTGLSDVLGQLPILE